jgi:hypothetical protein
MKLITVFASALGASAVILGCVPVSHGVGPDVRTLSLQFAANDSAAQVPREISLQVFVDSVRSDSIFGSYSGDLAELTLRVGRASSDRKLFRGYCAANICRFELSPDVADRGLVLSGESSGSVVTGEWITESRPRLRGSFSLASKQ